MRKPCLGGLVLQRHVRQLSMARIIICQELKSFLRISIRTWRMDQNPFETSHFLAIGVLTQAGVLDGVNYLEWAGSAVRSCGGLGNLARVNGSIHSDIVRIKVETAGSNRLLLIDPSLPQTRNDAHETGFDRPEEFFCHLIKRTYTECLQIAGIQCTTMYPLPQSTPGSPQKPASAIHNKRGDRFNDQSVRDQLGTWVQLRNLPS